MNRTVIAEMTLRANFIIEVSGSGQYLRIGLKICGCSSAFAQNVVEAQASAPWSSNRDDFEPSNYDDEVEDRLHQRIATSWHLSAPYRESMWNSTIFTPSTW